MQKGLFSKYFTICASLIFISITTLGVVLLSFASEYFEQEKLALLENNAKHAVEITKRSYEENNNNFIKVSDVIPGYKILASAIDADIYLADMDGETRICTHMSACNHTVHIIDSEVLNQAVTNGSFTDVGLMNGIYREPHYTVGIPLYLDETVPSGVLFVSVEAEEQVKFLNEIGEMFLISALLVVLLAFIMIYFMTGSMVQPLRQMVAATKSFSQGDFTSRIPVEGEDEIAQLAIAFNNMAYDLATLESTRRSFIANVSHELKTPMTTIAGFVDGILDGTIPKEKQEHYLKIVSDEVKRLSRVVRSMLNIARIEAGEQEIKPQVVDIHELVCRTVFTFEKAIEEKNLDVRGLDTDKVMVKADPDLIHQVVYNLVENAVKFASPNGYIEFTYTTEGKKTYVGIRNSGQGLAKDEIPKVFDRFYKTDSSRSKDKTGVGLGLNIVKSIVKLHGGEIIVRSIEGEYSEFAFSVDSVPAKK